MTRSLPRDDARLTWVPQEVQKAGSASMAGQMWVDFPKTIRSSTQVEPDIDHAVLRHKMLDAVVRASETGQRVNVGV